MLLAVHGGGPGGVGKGSGASGVGDLAGWRTLKRTWRTISCIMLKRLALKYWPLALLLVLIVAVLGISRYAERRKAENQEYTQTSSPESAVPPLNADKSTKKTNKPKYPPSLVDTFAWPEGVTAWALFLTLLVIAWQSIETRDAANASRDSLKIQEAEFVQWVDIGEWKIEYDRGVYRLSRSGTQIFNHPGEMMVRLSFPLFNNTARPLFIKSVRTLLAIGTEKVFKTFSTDESITVPPKDEYRVVIDTTLDKEQVTGYIAYMLPIEAVVQVNFSNALHKPDYAGFRRLVMCNAFDGITTVSKGHLSKEIDNQEGTQRPWPN